MPSFQSTKQNASSDRSHDGSGAEAGGRIPLRQLASHHQQRGDRLLPGQQEGEEDYTGCIRETCEFGVNVSYYKKMVMPHLTNRRNFSEVYDTLNFESAYLSYIFILFRIVFYGRRLSDFSLSVYVIVRFYFQVDHLKSFIFFRFSMGLVDNIIAKCKYLKKARELFKI